ncbi:hypothetical protein [Streptomyces gilvosporeus]|uniref:Uncharacterized protein n=1 Tax=Streptomyces gilvosporeus TaxID=553510 RepID=A0A1V0TQQ8_9ACTN|nr:hypothetical protein [Streptomyces gilvosporeus]ARF55279.1 hypothetical protein B1H19_14735 [Streptomyces gilvosporeus]
MTHSPHFTLRLALGLADPDTADALAARQYPEVLALLSDRFGLPEEMVEELLGADPAQMRAALAIDPEEWLLGAAELGDPAVGRALWDAKFRNDAGQRWRAMHKIPGLLTAVLAAADLGDPRWHDDDGLLPLLYQVSKGPDLVPVLTSGFPGLTAGTLVGCAAFLPPPVVVDACLDLLEIWGGTEPFAKVLALLEETPVLDLGHPWLPDLLRRALDAPDPAALLREHRPGGQWEDPAHLHALIALRYGSIASVPPQKPDGLDWDLLWREHERLPISRRGMYRGRVWPNTLIQWEGCPTDVVKDKFHADPDATIRTVTELPFEVLTEPCDREVSLDLLLGRGIREGWFPLDRVLTEVSPAPEVLRALPYDHEPTRKALADLLAPLGTDPVNWLTCYAALRRATGTVAELIADVLTPRPRKKRHTSWPQPRKAPASGARSQGARAAFLGLFRCASQEAQTAVVPHFDAMAVQQFLRECGPSPAVRDAVVAAHGLPASLMMTGGRIDADTMDYLLDLDEPAVDVALFRRYDLPRPERERILAGRLRGGGIRPVSGELLAELDKVIVHQDRDWLTAGAASGDLRVVRRVLERLRLYIPATRLRLLVAVWERGGPDAVREVLAMDRLPVTLRRQTEKLLDAPDGLEQLRARLAGEADPDRIAAFLAKPGGRPEKRLAQLLGEGVEPPWAALVTAHRATPLPEDLVEALVELPGCPGELLRAGLGAPGRWRNWNSWIEPALKDGTLALDDLLTHTAPAELAYDFLLRCLEERHSGESWTTDEDWRRLRERTAALAREHLGADAEGWAVCLQLLPAFAGTLSELLATAGAMTRMPA